LAGGTRFIWVVRLSGPRQVEVYEPGKPCRIVRRGQQLQAPGVLKNPIPVEALYDTDVAHRTALRNLLQRQGYADLDAVRDEARGEAVYEGLRVLRTLVLRLLRHRFEDLSGDQERCIEGLSIGQLDLLGEALLAFQSRDDLIAWLESNS
jgi:hypothetical protein